MTKPVLIDSNFARKEPTKREQAKQLYIKYHNLSRDQIAEKFVEELLITIESAHTHVSLCAKELNSTLNKPYLTRKHDPNKLKKVKAYNIFTQNPQMNRKQIIAEFQSKLGMTENSAATHCSMCAKEYKQGNTITDHKALS